MSLTSATQPCCHLTASGPSAPLAQQSAVAVGSGGNSPLAAGHQHLRSLHCCSLPRQDALPGRCMVAAASLRDACIALILPVQEDKRGPAWRLFAASDYPAQLCFCFL